MPEIINNEKVFSLLEVAKSIEKTITERYSSSFWVKAEMIKLNFYSHSGHAYPELVEKINGKVVAQIKSTIWSSNLESINQKFIQVTKEPLKDGINIMFRAKVSFNPAYGLSLVITDIEPSYTLGELEKEKQETIKRLTAEQIINKNKELKLPLLPQRIAIISVETSKGYADFINVIDNNSWGYCFFHMLFPSLLQGDQAVTSIIKQLNRIRKVLHHFDLVTIIRGGGGDIGLSCYNNYELSKEIALFPIPVLTGIGHSTNETVAEMVSNINSITPTKLAEYLIQSFHNFNVPLKDNERIVKEFALQLLKDKNQELNEISKYFQASSKGLLVKNKSNIRSLNSDIIMYSGKFLNEMKVEFQDKLTQLDSSTRIMTQQARITISEMGSAIKAIPASIIKNKNAELWREIKTLGKSAGIYIDNKRNKIEEQEKQVNLLDPVNVLERGYSITYLNGKALNKSTEVNQGDILETRLHNGKLESIVKSTNLAKWKKRDRTQRPSKSFRE